MLVFEYEGAELPPELLAKSEGQYTVEVAVEDDGTLTVIAKPLPAAAPRRLRRPDDSRYTLEVRSW